MLEIFLDLLQSMERAKERAGVTTPDQDSYFEELLRLSAGSTLDHPVVYRPYWVAANILEQDINNQKLVKAGDVQFTQMVTVIKSLRALQLAFDNANGLTIPEGMQIVLEELPGQAPLTFSPSRSGALLNRLIF